MEVAIRDAGLYQAGFPAAAAGLSELGVSHIEVAIDRDGVVRSLEGDERLDLTTQAGLDTLKAQLAGHQVSVCALLCAQDFNSNAGEPGPHLDWVVQAVRAADALGARAVRIDSAMTGQAELPLEERVRIFADAVIEVLRRTPESEVGLGIENHGRQGNDPEWMGGVIRRVGSPRLGLTLDVGNWYWYGHPLSRVYEIYRELGPLVKATHVKNIAYPAEMRETQRAIGYEYGRYVSPLDEGDLDMARVAAILRECGYDGPLTIEDESLGKFPEAERPAVLKRDVAHLRTAIGSIREGAGRGPGGA